MSITLVGLDADDTLWHSESHFAVTEEKFRSLLEPWLPADDISDRLLSRERKNLEIFGYGAKGFTLSMIETAIEVSDGSLPIAAIQQLIDWGKELSNHPVDLLDGVRDVLHTLADRYRLVLITKGDLFHQESKVAKSGVVELFERVEILSEKSPDAYRKVLARCEVEPSEFVMVGNSVRSDVLPVVEIGGRAVHVPYGITWGHEKVDTSSVDITWEELAHLRDLPDLLKRL